MPAAFLGGSLDDRGFAIVADAAGNAYIAGDTVSLNFPLMTPIQSTNHDTSNGWVAFVTKLNPTGTALIYSTFLGGVADSHSLGLAIDAFGATSFRSSRLPCWSSPSSPESRESCGNRE